MAKYFSPAPTREDVIKPAASAASPERFPSRDPVGPKHLVKIIENVIKQKFISIGTITILGFSTHILLSEFWAPEMLVEVSDLPKLPAAEYLRRNACTYGSLAERTHSDTSKMDFSYRYQKRKMECSPGSDKSSL